VGNSSGKVDPPTCRTDLVQKAAAELKFPSAFDWINEREAIRVTEDARNRWLRADEIRELARVWILQGKHISCVPETRQGYRDRRHFHYDVIVENIDDFPRGLYVEMELCSLDENAPTVNLLNAHPPSRP
jgi:hypothetical protein